MIARSLHRGAGATVAGVTSFWGLGMLVAGVCAGFLETAVDYRAAFVAALIALGVALSMRSRWWPAIEP